MSHERTPKNKTFLKANVSLLGTKTSFLKIRLEDTKSGKYCRHGVMDFGKAYVKASGEFQMGRDAS